MATETGSFAGKLPPQNLDAERGVLGSIMLLNYALDEVADTLDAEHFYSDAHRRIYAALKVLRDSDITVIDAVTVAEELSRRGELEAVGGVEYLMQVLEAVPHAAHAKYYADIVRDKWIQRSLIYACTDILKSCYEPGTQTEELLGNAERQVFQILENQDSEDKIAMKDILQDAFNRIKERMAMEGSVSGLQTGFSDLDGTTNGFQPTELIILAARPSMGKTALVCNLAEGVARHENRSVLIFSLEQSKLELAERFLCIHSQINGHDLRSGDLDEEQRKRLIAGSNTLSTMPLFLDDRPGRTMAQIGAIARRLKRKAGKTLAEGDSNDAGQADLGMIIIDYLQLIEPEDKSQPREQQIAQITRRLKFLAKELEVPVIALAQLNRGVELREDKRPRLADLRESGAIEQDADIVMFLHRPDAYDPQDRPGEAELIIAKNRSGPTNIVKLTWRKEFMRFENFSSLAEPSDGYFSDASGSF